MARDVDTIETMLMDLDRTFDRHGETFVVSMGPDRPQAAIHVQAPVLVVQVAIGTLPVEAGAQNLMMRQLLSFNSTDLIHAAYALKGEDILLGTGLVLESTDKSELAAVLSDIDVALARHIRTLRDLHPGESSRGNVEK